MSSQSGVSVSETITVLPEVPVHVTQILLLLNLRTHPHASQVCLSTETNEGCCYSCGSKKYREQKVEKLMRSPVSFLHNYSSY